MLTSPNQPSKGEKTLTSEAINDYLEFRRLLFQFCQTPRTITEISEKFGLAYHTARRQIQRQIDEGLLIEMPFREGFKKQYRANFEGKPEWETFTPIMYENRPVPALELLNGMFRSAHEFSNPIRRITGAVAHVAMQGFYKHNKMKDLLEGPSQSLVIYDLLRVEKLLEELLKVVRQFKTMGVADDPEKFWERLHKPTPEQLNSPSGWWLEAFNKGKTQTPPKR